MPDVPKDPAPEQTPEPVVKERKKSELEVKLETSAALAVDILTSDLGDGDPKIRDKAAVDLITKHTDFVAKTIPPPPPPVQPGTQIVFNMDFISGAVSSLKTAFAGSLPGPAPAQKVLTFDEVSHVPD